MRYGIIVFSIYHRRRQVYGFNKCCETGDITQGDTFKEIGGIDINRNAD
jgi:hypothetical protein